jgi:hypothetical protein
MSTLIKGSPHITSTHPPTGETDQVPSRLWDCGNSPDSVAIFVIDQADPDDSSIGISGD